MPGFLSAVIAVLLDAGWDPLEAYKWVAPDGVVWAFPQIGCESVDVWPFVRAFEKSLEEALWLRASRHCGGDRLRVGADLLRIRREMDSLFDKGEHGLWAANVAVVTGASWPRTRQVAEGLSDDPICPRCKAALEMLLHRVWTCPCNKGHPDYDSTDKLVRKAIECHAENEAYWLRGVTNSEMTRLEEDRPEKMPVKLFWCRSRESPHGMCRRRLLGRLWRWLWWQIQRRPEKKKSGVRNCGGFPR